MSEGPGLVKGTERACHRADANVGHGPGFWSGLLKRQSVRGQSCSVDAPVRLGKSGSGGQQSEHITAGRMPVRPLAEVTFSFLFLCRRGQVLIIVS